MTLALIAEDEAPQREALCEILRAQWPELELLHCDDGDTALRLLHERSPQIAFLDIRMPGASGLEVAAVASGRAHVVFVTAYDEHALSAFEAGAVDYLLKPVNATRLATTVSRLKERLSQAVPADLTAVLHQLQARLQPAVTQPIRWITASMGEVIKVLSIDEVLCFIADHKYTRVVTREGEALIRTSLKELLPGLSADEFWQIHRSTVIRVSAIHCVRRNELGRMDVQLEGVPELLPVSQTCQHLFKGM